MNENKYALAGWLAIASVVLFFPEFALTALNDMHPEKFPGLGNFILPLVIIETACSIYAFIRFKHLLNDEYEFHKTDTLIIMLICCGLLITAVTILGRALPDFRIIAAISLGAIGVPTAIAGIVFGIKLLSLTGTLNGMKKPLAYSHIAGSICFATFILIPLGLLIMAAFNIMLGITFLRWREEERLPEFV